MHRHIGVVQCSPEWHKLRDDPEIFRASELGAIIGVGYTNQKTWRTIYDKRQSTGEMPDQTEFMKQFGKVHIERGHRMEVVIFDNLRHSIPGIHCKCGAFIRTWTCKSGRILKFLASPDSIHVADNGDLLLLEIKCPISIERHLLTNRQHPHPQYLVQVLVQMYCTGIQKAILVMGEEGELGKLKECVYYPCDWSDELWITVTDWIEEALQFPELDDVRGRRAIRAETLSLMISRECHPSHPCLLLP